MRRLVASLAAAGGLAVVTPASAATVFDGANSVSSAGPSPIALQRGALDADGNPDLVVANQGTFPSAAGNTAVLLGNGAGSFNLGPGSPYSNPGGSPDFLGSDVAVGDLNGDGLDDVLTATPGGVRVYLANPNGSLTAVSSPGTPSGDIDAIATGYFNADTKLDIVVTQSGGPVPVTVSLGQGNGTFTPGGSASDGTTTPTQLAVGRFNGDAIDDVAVSTFNDDTVSILLGDGSGGLTPASPSTIPVGDSPTRLATGDFNNDRKTDLAVPSFNNPSMGVTILRGNGNGTFTASPLLPTSLTGDRPDAVAVADFDSDGNQDLVIANDPNPGGPGTATVLLGAGDAATFNAGATLNARNDPIDVTAADFNKDGHPDVAVANFGSNSISSFLAQAPVARGTGVQPSTPISNTPVVPIIDRTPPTQTISFPRQTLKSVLRDGLLMFASCSEPCAFRADALVKSATRKPRRRHGRAARMVTAGAANAVLGSTRRRVVVRIRKSARRALTRSRKLTLVTTATDTVGNASRVKRGLKLRRR